MISEVFWLRGHANGRDILLPAKVIYQRMPTPAENSWHKPIYTDESRPLIEAQRRKRLRRLAQYTNTPQSRFLADLHSMQSDSLPWVPMRVPEQVEIPD